MAKAALQGRYERVGSVALPVRERRDGAREWTTEEPQRPALPREGNRAGGKLRIKHGAVPDPDPARAGKRQRVAVNMHTDALETEYAYKRISEEAYRAGRLYQAVIEISRGRRSEGCRFEPRDRTSSATGHEWAIISRIERAEDAVELILSTRSVIGSWGELVLSAVLAEGLTFQQIAQQQRKGTDWERRVIARTFREGLESLAIQWSRIHP